MSGPRVLMLIQRFRPTFTGHGIQIETMGRLLVGRGATVTIATARVDGAPDHESADGVTIRRFRLAGSRNPLATWRGNRDLLAFMRAHRDDFDILHIHGAPPALVFALPLARRLGWRTVITTTLLGSDDPVSLRGRGRLAWWRFRAYRGADRFVAICPALRDTYPKAGIPVDRVAHIPVGVDVARFRPAGDRDRAATALGMAVGVPRALFVGLVLKRKGVDVLLDAWERVLAAVPDAQLYVAGGTEFRAGTAEATFAASMLERASRGALAGRVTFLGRQDGLERHYGAAHVFVFPSRIEGFPNVVLEAIASGTPPVVTRIPGSTDESVRDGETGFVVEQEDAAALAERTVRLLRDAGLRDRFAAAARADAEARYAFEHVAEAHLALYADLLGRG